MSPYYHSKIHSKKYGGSPDDYLQIDEFIDSSKTHYANIKHRAMLHSSFGIYIVEKVFGPVITISTGKKVCVREVTIDHILQDLGFIPTMEMYLNNMQIQPWMSGTEKRNTGSKHKFIKLED